MYDESINALLKAAQVHSLETAEQRRFNRREIFELTVAKQGDIDEALLDVHTLHWLDRLAYHTWRSIHYIHACTNYETVLEDQN